MPHEDVTYRVSRNVSTYNSGRRENYPEESIQHAEHGERLKSRIHISSPVQLTKQNYWIQGAPPPPPPCYI